MSDDQFSQLNSHLQQLDDQAKSFQQEFLKIQQGFQKMGGQFLKLYQHIELRFNELEAKLDTKADKSQVDSIFALLDAHEKRRETDEQERLAMGSQLGRHQLWIEQLAENTATTLDPGP
jgi:hypothetical protein